MRYAMINVVSNRVENIIELSDKWPKDKSWDCPKGYYMVDSDFGNIGDAFDRDTGAFNRPADANAA